MCESDTPGSDISGNFSGLWLRNHTLQIVQSWRKKIGTLDAVYYNYRPTHGHHWNRKWGMTLFKRKQSALLLRYSSRFCEILASTYGTGPLGPYGPGPLITLKNILRSLCSRTIFEKHTAQEHIANMLLEHHAFQIWSWSIFDLEILSDNEWFRTHMVLDRKSRPKLPKSILPHPINQCWEIWQGF